MLRQIDTPKQVPLRNNGHRYARAQARQLRLFFQLMVLDGSSASRLITSDPRAGHDH